MTDNKRVKVDFEGVQHVADVFVDNKLVVNHVGGWISFSADITDFIKPGKQFIPRVHVKGGSQPPIVDEKGYPLWPVGLYGHQPSGQGGKWGIIFHVWLRSYGAIHIEDAFIRTSVRNNTISVDYELRNDRKQARTVIVNGFVTPERDNKEAISFESDPITLQPGEIKNITISKQWNNPHHWNIEDPFLYILKSAVTVQGTKDKIDNEQRRFGFREIWIKGNQYWLNGHRMNFRGDNINNHKEKAIIENQNYEAYGEFIDRWKKLNFNIVRFHTDPASPYILDLADEKGMFVICETALYSRGYMLYVDMPRYLENARTWVGDFVKASRNHPSVVIWSALNEMGRNYIRVMTDSEMRTIGDAIHASDPTRSVSYDGEMDLGAETVCLHYPMIYLNRERGDIYQWSKYVHPSKPTGLGEFLLGRKSYISAIWTRGMRYVNFAEFRPFTLNWTWNDGQSRTRTGELVNTTGKRVVLGYIFNTDWEAGLENDPVYYLMRNSYAPLALFDKEYDRLGGEIYENQKWPNLYEGTIAERSLILYNDDYTDTNIEVKISIVYNNKSVATGSKMVSLALGEHFDIPVTFQVPVVQRNRGGYESQTAGAPFEMILTTFKNGIQKFEEHKQFYIRATGYNVKSDSNVRIGEPRKSDY